MQLQISQDGGQTWEAQCGRLTTIGNGNQAEGEPLYNGILTDWTFEEIDLAQYIGEEILFRFQLVSDGFVNLDGFYSVSYTHLTLPTICSV